MEQDEKKPGSIAELISENEARRVKQALQAVFTAVMISVAYFGIIALLMSPAFDVAPPA